MTTNDSRQGLHLCSALLLHSLDSADSHRLGDFQKLAFRHSAISELAEIHIRRRTQLPRPNISKNSAEMLEDILFA